MQKRPHERPLFGGNWGEQSEAVPPGRTGLLVRRPNGLTRRQDNTRSPDDNRPVPAWNCSVSGLFFSLFLMALTPDDIRRIAHLARLELAEPERDRMLAQINGFFSIVEAMRAVDTKGVEPLAHPVAAFQEVHLRLREDRASEPNQREANQRSAPAVERGLFLVPKVIE